MGRLVRDAPQGICVKCHASNSSGSISSTEHHTHRSPGSIERIRGCATCRKCFVACLFFDESQHPTCPQIKHMRKWTHLSPIFTHSSQTCVVGFVTLIWSR